MLGIESRPGSRAPELLMVEAGGLLWVQDPDGR